MLKSGTYIINTNQFKYGWYTVIYLAQDYQESNNVTIHYKQIYDVWIPKRGKKRFTVSAKYNDCLGGVIATSDSGWHYVNKHILNKCLELNKKIGLL